MKTEKIFAALFIIGLVLKSIHIPGGNSLLILTLVTLSIAYFPFGFYMLSGSKMQQNIGLSIGVGMVLSVSVIGILFRVMHWPGAAVMQIFGLITALPLLILVHALRKKTDLEAENDYFRGLILRMTTVSIVALLLFSLSFSAFRI